MDSYLLRFHCAGDEKSLLECPRSLVDKCENDDVALFSCGGTPQLLLTDTHLI